MSTPPLPYGPQTPAIRHFLVRLAGLSRHDRARAVEAYVAHSATAAFQRAEATLATVMERSGREEARDAVSGPFLQLVQRPDRPTPGDTLQPDDDTTPLDGLEPIAEPALAALMALLVRDLLPPEDFANLVAPIATVLDLGASDASPTAEAPR